MICYESIVKNIVDVTLPFSQYLLFLVVVGSSMIFYYFILTSKELAPQQL